MRKSLLKRRWLILAILCVIVLFAAPFIYAAFQSNHFPFEPPIEEQARLQYDALISGEDIPMPIPLVVDGTELKEHSLDALRDTLTTAGFKEVTGANINEFTQDVQTQYKSDPMFASLDEKLLVVWKDKPRPLLKSNAIMAFATERGMTKTEIDEYFSDGCGEILSLPFGVELGSSTSDALEATRWIDKDYRFSRAPRRLGRRYSESIVINRGCYMYLFYFSEGRLRALTISEMRYYMEPDISGMSEEQAIEYLEGAFGKRTAMEKLNRTISNLLAKYGR